MIMDLIIPALLSSPDHSFRDIIDVFRGMNFSLEHLFHEMVTFDYDKQRKRSSKRSKHLIKNLRLFETPVISPASPDPNNFWLS
jgi:hypothetical protein